MAHLRSVRYQKPERGGDDFPFDVPVIRSMGELSLDTSITILVGENGTGKSTFLEALACACGSIAAGDEPLERDPTLTHARRLGEAFRLVWNRRTRKGFFLRAEDFFRYVHRLSASSRELESMEEDFGRRFTGYAKQLAQGSARAQRTAIDGRYGGGLDARSHGESFLAFFQARLVPGGLYLIDEPEAALSPQRQLSLLVMLKDMAEEKDCQFVIATHAPVLMACPGATLLSFDEDPPAVVDFDDLEHVRFLRDFLAAPERFLRHL